MINEEREKLLKLREDQSSKIDELIEAFDAEGLK